MVITGSLGERLGGQKLSRGFESRPLRQFLNDFLSKYFKIKIRLEWVVVLDGEIAVPCNLQSATAGLNSYPRFYLFEAG